MKNILTTALFIAGTFALAPVYAHSKTDNDTSKTISKIKRGFKKAGNKTAEIAVKGESAVADRVYAGKVGPGGKTVYINKNDKYYYVNEKGRKVFITKVDLRDKTK